MPNLPGIYIFKGRNNETIYIGKAKSLKNRVSSYFRKAEKPPKTEALLKAFKSIEFIVTSSEIEALLLENKLIKKHKPKYNILLRDDKSYPYIKITINEEWPRLITARKKENDGALYFGPYSGRSVKENIRLLRKLFPIRACKSPKLLMREQPCLQFHIKRCWGPCIGKISNEQYRGFCKAAASILSGNISDTISLLTKEMQSASSEKNYENAAKLRDKISSLMKLVEKKPAWAHTRSHSAYLKATQEIKEMLSLPSLPKRIEAFDVSNISGQDVVASMAVFEGENPKKEDYRRFIIRSFAGQNDTAAIFEAVKRRYGASLSTKLALPDLILIDGGKPQLSSAYKALKSLTINVPMIALAKREEEIFKIGGAGAIKPDKNSDMMLLLRRIRDEAHRFAVKFHRERRLKRFLVR